MPRAKAAAPRSLYDWEWKEVDTHHRRAIELNPGYATAHHCYAVDYLANVDRMAEAFGHMRQARSA